MAVKAGSTKKPLGAELGLTTADPLEMYRLVALARAVDQRMWILNRAGRLPFVTLAQRHAGPHVGIPRAPEKGQA